MTPADAPARQALLRRGLALEYVTLAWNVIGIVVLTIAAIAARSVALAGFGLDSLIEIGASTVVIWELSGRRVRAGLLCRPRSTGHFPYRTLTPGAVDPCRRSGGTVSQRVYRHGA
jgi:hypothetical protein